MDDFIATITRTQIFAGLSREDLARVAGQLEEVGVKPEEAPTSSTCNVYQIAYFGTGELGFSHAQRRRFLVAKLVVSLLAIAVSIPWWQALGLVL